jgi:hypothetical protein
MPLYDDVQQPNSRNSKILLKKSIGLDENATFALPEVPRAKLMSRLSKHDFRVASARF